MAGIEFTVYFYFTQARLANERRGAAEEQRRAAIEQAEREERMQKMRQEYNDLKQEFNDLKQKNPDVFPPGWWEDEEKQREWKEKRHQFGYLSV